MSDPWYSDGLKFTCTQCGNCCTGAPGYVWVSPDEVKALAEHLDVPVFQFRAMYTRTEGKRRTLRERPNGDCVFWERGKGCTVYAARPTQCRTWPFWESTTESPNAWKELQQGCPVRQRTVLHGRRDNGPCSNGASVNVTPELRDRVIEVYRTADAAVAAHSPICQKSGRCCRFTEYGHTLFLSDMEAEILLDGATITSASRDSCPFQIEGLCTARDERPLACRIYFCDVTFQEAMPVIAEEFNRQLKRIADEEGLAWRYAPLHEFLAERAGTTPEAMPGRLNLQVISKS